MKWKTFNCNSIRLCDEFETFVTPTLVFDSINFQKFPKKKKSLLQKMEIN
jgi:hypothetical protein